MPPKPKHSKIKVLWTLLGTAIMLGGAFCSIYFSKDLAQIAFGDKAFPAWAPLVLFSWLVGESVAFQNDEGGLTLLVLRRIKSAWDGRNGKQQ